jgi:two-component system OmpR family response regulator
MQDTPRLLLIEDDRQISHALEYALRSTHAVEIANTGQAGLNKSEYGSYAAIVLDLNLPDLSGLEVCRQLREQAVTTPILILSAENSILTKINLLDAGANDYLVKPFSLGELKARLRVLARHSRNQMQQNRRLEIASLILDTATREVNRDGQAISLRRKEFALLECLMAHAGTVVTRETLTKYAWEGAEEPWTNTIDVHIKYLRDKLDRPFHKPLIKTVHGIGYRLDPAAAAAISECVA